MMKKIYVSIPITGKNYIDQRNYALYVATNLAQRGYDAVTPFDIVKDPTTSYNRSLGMCIESLLDCDTIYMCSGWEKSLGCRAELQVAMVYGKEVMTDKDY